MTTNQSPTAGHYHDPEGKYDYCADPKCPRVAKGLYSRREIGRMTNDALDELLSYYNDTGNSEGAQRVQDELAERAQDDEDYAEAEAAYDAEQDRQQMLHDEMINDAAVR